MDNGSLIAKFGGPKEQHPYISGTRINMSSDDIKNAKSVDDIAKLDIFPKYTDSQKADANKKVWEYIEQSRLDAGITESATQELGDQANAGGRPIIMGTKMPNTGDLTEKDEAEK